MATFGFYLGKGMWPDKVWLLASCVILHFCFLAGLSNKTWWFFSLGWFVSPTQACEFLSVLWLAHGYPYSLDKYPVDIFHQ